jgi:kumamolisin
MTNIPTHAVVGGSERAVLPGAKAIGRANPNAIIEVTLKLRGKEKLPALTGRPATALTREQVANKYGASQDDINKVIHTFGKYGLKPVHTNPGTQTVRFRGPIAAMEQAFQVKLFNYAHETEPYRGRTGKYYVPKSVEGIVTGVFGLDNRRIARRKKQRHVGTIAHASHQSSWYIPSELALHYSFPDGDGQGQTVGLLEFGGGYFEDDLKKFCKMANVSPVPEVKAISTDGTPTNSKDGAEGEVMLDVEIVAGICPKADIAVYFAGWGEQGWITALDAAYSDQENDPGVISASWGLAEGEIWDQSSNQGWTVAAMQHVNDTLEKAALTGVTVCIAAGDDGSSDDYEPPDGLAHVDFPASSPYVLSVGGTTIPTKGGTQPDIVWKEGDGIRPNGGSTGGGVSANWLKEDLAPWQKNIPITSINPGAFNGRVIPDLAANADWTASPYLLVVDGKSQPNGGTSAASPLLAGLLTLINAERPTGKRVGFLTPVLYQGNPTVGAIGCTDVVAGNPGNNDTATIGGYNVGKGYDAVSGWGTPNGKKLAKAIPT